MLLSRVSSILVGTEAASVTLFREYVRGCYHGVGENLGREEGLHHVQEACPGIDSHILWNQRADLDLIMLDVMGAHERVETGGS